MQIGDCPLWRLQAISTFHLAYAKERLSIRNLGTTCRFRNSGLCQRHQAGAYIVSSMQIGDCPRFARRCDECLTFGEVIPCYSPASILFWRENLTANDSKSNEKKSRNTSRSFSNLSFMEYFYRSNAKEGLSRICMRVALGVFAGEVAACNCF